MSKCPSWTIPMEIKEQRTGFWKGSANWRREARDKKKLEKTRSNLVPYEMAVQFNVHLDGSGGRLGFSYCIGWWIGVGCKEFYVNVFDTWLETCYVIRSWSSFTS